MWGLAILSVVVCILLWTVQIKSNIQRKNHRKKEKVIRKLERYAEQSEYGDIYEDIIDLYENSDSIEIEEIVQNSRLPRYEKGPVIVSLNKILKTGIDEKTGFHKKTLVLGKMVSYFLSFLITFFFVCIKNEFFNIFLEVVLIYAGCNLVISFISYIVIESIILKKLPWSSGENIKEECINTHGFFERIYDVLDTIFGRY